MSRQFGNGETKCAHSRQNLVPTGDILLRKCNICRDAIFGVGTCLKCNGCSDYFHEICVRPQPTLLHPFYPAVEFNFTDGQGTTAGRRCVACYQRIQGCVYVGNGNNAMYIHPFCLVHLRESVSDATIAYHKQKMGRLLETYDSSRGGRVANKRLELDCQMSLSAGVECIVCKREDTINREFGWAYNYTYTAGGISAKFECHVACLRALLNKFCLNQIISKHPGSTYDQRTYFLQLSSSKLEDTAKKVAGFALPVAVAGLDLMISAFVGAPLVSILLSFLLGIAADKAESVLRRPGRN